MAIRLNIGQKGRIVFVFGDRRRGTDAARSAMAELRPPMLQSPAAAEKQMFGAI
jgi:hypothetical protein